MKIIVLNCGSSSIKYQLFNTASKEVHAKGAVERIGMLGATVKHTKQDGEKVSFEGEILDHQMAIEYILGILTSKKHGCLKSFEEIDAVGHRVVHGGEKFSGSVLLKQEVINQLEECSDLAPLHNPPNLKGIYAMKEILPTIPQVGAFDTAFHQSMPKHAYMYAIPNSLYRKHAIRRYGFHGSSHRYVSKRACDILAVNVEDKKIITCHLGNGASIAAIKNGKSYDTSMGLTPVEGLIMGTRTGDMDLGALIYVMQKEDLSIQTANTLINKFSGILGVSGISSDMREVEKAAWEKGNENAQLALDMYHYRIKKYIGSYAAAMGGVDVIIFTGGVGENACESREEICNEMEYMGLEFDKEANDGKRGKEVIISKPSSKVTVMVVPTDEEYVIAMDTEEIVSKMI